MFHIFFWAREKTFRYGYEGSPKISSPPIEPLEGFLKHLLFPWITQHSIMVITAGKKRASPGADVEKNPLSNVELSDADAQRLQVVQNDIARTELLLGGYYVLSLRKEILLTKSFAQNVAPSRH